MSESWKSKMKLAQQLFYGIALVIDYGQFALLLNQQNLIGAKWLWPVIWMEHLSLEHQALVFQIAFVLMLLLHSLNFLWPEKILYKFLSAGLFFMLVAASFSFGKIDHSLHSFVLASFFIAGLGKQTKSRQELLYKSAQMCLLMIYFLSGVWKARIFVQAILAQGWSDTNPIVVNLVWNKIQSFAEPPSPALAFWQAHPAWSKLAWILVILFEVLTVAALWLPKWQRLWIVLLIFFHAAVAVQMNIYFFATSLLAIALFVINPFADNDREQEE